jgi:hypothetical protein
MLEHLVPNTATPYIVLKFEVVGAGMAVATVTITPQACGG